MFADQLQQQSPGTGIKLRPLIACSLNISLVSLIFLLNEPQLLQRVFNVSTNLQRLLDSDKQFKKHPHQVAKALVSIEQLAVRQHDFCIGISMKSGELLPAGGT